MSTRPLLNEPPIYTTITFNGKLTASWKNWFNSISNAFGQFFRAYGPNTANSQSVVFVVGSLTTTERDALTDVDAGAIIYNTSTNAFNFYENGNWVTK